MSNLRFFSFTLYITYGKAFAIVMFWNKKMQKEKNEMR